MSHAEADCREGEDSKAKAKAKAKTLARSKKILKELKAELLEEEEEAAEAATLAESQDLASLEGSDAETNHGTGRWCGSA